MEPYLKELKKQVEPMERFVELFARSLEQPKLRQINLDRGFRYDSPDIRHFCLLKLVRVMSAFNAAIELARTGYTQEIAVLMRTLVECTTHIDFVLDPNDSETHKAAVEKYVREFFEDARREPTFGIKNTHIKQGAVHDVLGKSLDIFAAPDEGRRPAKELYSNVYRIFSNYVHAKYPEIMDLYGGVPGCFHMHGMRGTPKDAENLETIHTFVGTASNAIRLTILKLNLFSLIETDPIVASWYSRMRATNTGSR